LDGHETVGRATSRHRAAPHVLRVRREQLSVKITEEACDRFRRLAAEHRLTLGELFEQALDAWEAEVARLGTCHAPAASAER
jgi:hypothetical protein